MTFLIWYFVLSIPLLWVLWLAVANLGRAEEELPKFTQRAGKCLLLLGYIHDFLCNVFPVSVLFLQVPHETTVSERLKKLVKGEPGWRKQLAIWFAVNLINPGCPKNDPHIPL